MNLILFFLASVGLSQIMVESEIVKPFRDKVKEIFGVKSKITYMVNCHQCMGLWCGFVMSILWHVFFPISNLPWGFEQFVFGCANSVLATLTAVVITYLDVIE